MQSQVTSSGPFLYSSSSNSARCNKFSDGEATALAKILKLIPAIGNNNDQAPATPRQFSIGISNLAGTLECDDPENDEKKWDPDIQSVLETVESGEEYDSISSDFLGP